MLAASFPATVNYYTPSLKKPGRSLKPFSTYNKVRHPPPMYVKS